MPHERVPYIRYAEINTPQSCRRCPTAQAVARAGRAAVSGLRKNYDQRPDYASGDTACWVRQVDNAWFRSTDPRYRELLAQYEIAARQQQDMRNCPGGALSRHPDGSVDHICPFTPSPDLPELPLPPGTVQITPPAEGHKE